VGAVTTGSGNLAAGSYQQSADAALVGVDAGNYTTAPTTVANYVVTPKAITATVTAANKVYDGTTTATMTANSAGIEVGDQVTVQGVVGTFASKNVVRDGTGNAIAQAVTVSGTGVGLAGADGANYTLTNATNITATTAIITPVTLTGTIAAVTTTYGTNAATGAVSLGGVIAGDTVNASAAALVGGTLSSSGNPVEVLRASIVAFVPVTPDPGRVGVAGTSGGSRVSFGGGTGTGAATGVNDEPLDPEMTEQCSVLSPEKCECESTPLSGVEMCFAPTRSVSLKD
jgi:hypothetical protein